MTTPDANIEEKQSIGQIDPFSARAQAVNREKLITTDAERAEVAETVDQLAQHGYVILEKVIGGETLERMRAAIDAINEQTRLGIYEFEGHNTHRAYCVVSKTREFDELVMNRRVLAVIEAYFGETPQLSASMGMTIYEGQTAQPLHQDSGHYNLPWPRPPLEVNSIWAFDDFTAENGATRFIPASHKIHGERCPEGETSIARMSAGSVLIYDGSLWHGGGASTAKGARRRCINNIFTRQWLRQQDNIYLSIPKETAVNLPKLMQRLLGYWIYSYTLGVVDGRPPIEVLREKSGNHSE
jgi:ectoine hydroxylase-related dioxygenase (phytanoyl-CoA dioxygenase family)